MWKTSQNLFSISLAIAVLLVLLSCKKQFEQPGNKGLKDYYDQHFLVGASVSLKNLKGDEALLIKHQFNSITAENAMKMESLQPKEGQFNWRDADSIVNFAVKNNIKIRGHNLVWHQYTPSWMFIGKDGKQVTKTVLLQRLKAHITAVLGRYKGKIYAWDVINEAIDDSPNNYLRWSKWYEICGEDFIIKAFEYAHEADPSAKLFYNDYNTELPEKRERIYEFLNALKAKGVPIDGIGCQAHWSIYELTEPELTTAIQRYSSLGLEVQFTELDISIYPPETVIREKRVGEPDVFTKALEQRQIDKYTMVFKVFRDYSKLITSVSFWNVSDRSSWLDEFPVKGRKNYPLLFDQHLKPKSVYWKVTEF